MVFGKPHLYVLTRARLDELRKTRSCHRKHVAEQIACEVDAYQSPIVKSYMNISNDSRAAIFAAAYINPVGEAIACALIALTPNHFNP